MFSSWEYPGTAGVGCNSFSPNDTSNFLSFLQEFRYSSDTSDDLTISATVGLTPFIDQTGQPMTDVSDFAKVLDYIREFLRTTPAIRGVVTYQPYQKSRTTTFGEAGRRRLDPMRPSTTPAQNQPTSSKAPLPPSACAMSSADAMRSRKLRSFGNPVSTS